MLDMFASDPAVLEQLQTAHAAAAIQPDARKIAGPSVTPIGSVFGTGSDPGGTVHLVLFKTAICAATIVHSVPFGVIRAEISCSLCRPVVEAWPTQPFSPT
jgi:hypothetical protein